ncbi:MAG: thermonuclease family protein [Alphaproteobacteria bacterium]|nr:thermonuclease family protein [Alphaproteobacteria bacterium]
MNIPAFRVLAALVFWLGPCGDAISADHLSGPLAARVVRVIDGDTLVVRVQIWLDQEVETRVRLFGIDTPEIRGKCPEERRMALEARALVEKFGGDGEVFFRDVTYGKFAQRVVARVSSPLTGDFADALLRSGLARPYDGRRRLPWCKDTAH